MEYDIDFFRLALGSEIIVPDNSLNGAVIVAQQTHTLVEHRVNENELGRPLGGGRIGRRDRPVGADHMRHTEYLKQFFRLTWKRLFNLGQEGGQELGRRCVLGIPVLEFAFKIAMQFSVTITAEVRPVNGLIFPERDKEFAVPRENLGPTDKHHFIRHFFTALGQCSDAFEVRDEFVDMVGIGRSGWTILGVIHVHLGRSTFKCDGGDIRFGLGDKQERYIVKQT